MNKQLWSPSYLFFMAGSCGCERSNGGLGQ